mmetsp:Transcript_57622/g.137012  ORF Transcript_57622/g.137012 Transcript_57622/m.137012 type:complete len:226 (+) Transcript_57622:504-1181(+)
MGTASLMARSLASTSLRYNSSTRSHLLRMMRSAKATCSTASFSTPSGFSSSRCWMMCLASTSVRMPSSCSFCCTNWSAKNVWATGAGSAKPVVSMMTPSNGRFSTCEFFTSFFKPAIRSPRTVQQMHPLFISTKFSSVVMEPKSIRESSMPTSPNSFSMTAILFPCFSLRILFSRVVLPLPRKPVRTVTGILSEAAFEADVAAAVALAFLALTPSFPGTNLSAQS